MTEQTVQTAPTAPVAPAPQGSSLRRIFLINGIGLLALLVIGLGAFYLWHQGYYFYSTDDATVSGNVAAAAPAAPGSIVSVNHGLGATVKAGSTIATLRTGSG